MKCFVKWQLEEEHNLCLLFETKSNDTEEDILLAVPKPALKILKEYYKELPKEVLIEICKK